MKDQDAIHPIYRWFVAATAASISETLTYPLDGTSCLVYTRLTVR